MLLTMGIQQAIGENRADAVHPHRLGDRVEMSIDNHHAAFIYAEVSSGVPTAVTDIMTWVSMAARTVTNVVASVENYAAGLWTGSTLGVLADGVWLQYAGEKLTYASGSALSNNLLGDGAVAAVEALMPHATTAGMVDTYSGALILPIGVAFEADAPAITKYYLNFLCSAM